MSRFGRPLQRTDRPTDDKDLYSETKEETGRKADGSGRASGGRHVSNERHAMHRRAEPFVRSLEAAHGRTKGTNGEGNKRKEGREEDRYCQLASIPTSLDQLS